ncbi:hypothetical protein [Rodentibacter pneumotropicus]|nr:hypothetical protein [Rodentibacter pneumotropicus]
MDILVVILTIGILSFTLILFIRFLQTQNNREFKGEKLIPFSCGKMV